MDMNTLLRRITLVALLAFTVGAPLAFSESKSDGTIVTVYKNPSCGCCTKWVDHLREYGFKIIVHDTSNLDQIKARYVVPRALFSCHTAIVSGYVVEGHVPADVIERMLEERPKVIGIAVPGMPMGSPGMEGQYSEPYDVLTFDRDGRTNVYANRK